MHFNASTGLKMQLVAASFSFSPTFPVMQNASFPLGLDAPAEMELASPGHRSPGQQFWPGRVGTGSCRVTY